MAFGEHPFNDTVGSTEVIIIVSLMFHIHNIIIISLK